MGLRYAANISILFTEVPILERPAAAKAAGFDVVESWWPFPTAVPDSKEVDAFVTALADAGVRLQALNFFAGTLADGDRGVLSIPARSSEFAESIDVLVSIATETGCRLFNALYGLRVADATPHEQDALAVENIALAAQVVGRLGGTVLLEPLAEGENGTYPLLGPDDVMAVIDNVRQATGAANVRLLADFYHLARNGHTWADVIDQHFTDFGHVQIADAPGRHQPGTGEIDFPGLFAALESNGYEGYVGIEYRPEGPTLDSLAWLPREARGERTAIS